MKTYNVAADCKSIRCLLEKSQDDFANLIGVSFSTINRIENNQHFPTDETLEKMYSFAYSNSDRPIYLNKVKCSIYKDKYNNILFHGAKENIEGEVDLEHSRDFIDFGKGFYLGESYEQVAKFVSNIDKSSVYIFKYDFDNLNIIEFGVSLEWLIAVALFRGTISSYEKTSLYKNIKEKCDNADVIIAPIADNTIYSIINDFANGDITDQQAFSSLSASYLGKQYVIKSNKAIERLKFIDRLYISKPEKDDFKVAKTKDKLVAEDKILVAKQENRRKGLYIEEIFNEKSN